MVSKASFRETKLKELESRCREQGLPLTLQRRAILEVLTGRRDHPTADQVYDAVKACCPGISRTTVYRVLEMLVHLGVSRKINNPGAKARFDADTRRHHHLVCLACERVHDFPHEGLEEITLPRETGDGFAVFDYSLTVTGLCSYCKGRGLTKLHYGGYGTRTLPQRRMI